MFTLEDIKKELNKLSAMVGDEFDIPVALNGRLTRTLGRVHSECTNGVWYPVRMEFSKQFLETSTEECVISVIQHEWAHYYVTKSTHESHGHDATFKAVCARIGCENDGTKTRVERTVAESTVYKYQIWCPTCKKYISGLNRMCKSLREIQNYECKVCGNAGLSYVQNW
jgi:predicted SprT family Zn-dependent metalloprotease